MWYLNIKNAFVCLRAICWYCACITSVRRLSSDKILYEISLPTFSNIKKYKYANPFKIKLRLEYLISLNKFMCSIECPVEVKHTWAFALKIGPGNFWRICLSFLSGKQYKLLSSQIYKGRLLFGSTNPASREIITSQREERF